jgi:archaellum biogenesis ATPase FlaH
MDLELIADIINKFLKQSKNPVILLDGIEHLIFENGSAPVLRFLRDVGEWMVLQNAILILPINPLALEEKELALMERNMTDLEPRPLKILNKL